MISLLILAALNLDSLLHQPELNSILYGISIVRLDNNQTIFAANAEKLMIPASNMKILTTAAALYYLGADFRYKTRLAWRGRLHDGRLTGDIILIGGGDPKFGLDQCEQFLNTLRLRQVREITGNVVVVDDYFTREGLPTGWAWHYLDAYYAPEISALSFNENVVSVTMKATKPGELVSVQLRPETKYVQIVNRMLTRTGPDSIVIYRLPEANTIYLEGALNRNRQRTIRVAVKDPARFCGTYFRERLLAEQIRVAGTIIVGNDNFFINPDSAALVTVIDSTLSVPLASIVRETNTESVNLYAEILMKTLGVQHYGRGSYAAGLAATKEFLVLCGVDTALVSLSDGSGLSKYTLISAGDMVKVLRYCWRQPFFNFFLESLAAPGTGTMANRLTGFSDSLRAKTGALDAVSCLSGYLTVNNIPCCFSLLFNNFTCSFKKINAIQEGIIWKLADHLKKNVN